MLTELPRQDPLDVLHQLREDTAILRDYRLLRAELRQTRDLLSQALSENLMLRGIVNALQPPEEMIP